MTMAGYHYVTRAFRELPIGTQFSTGSDWLKTSTRTARLNGNGAVYYFRQTDVVRVGSGHWQDMVKK